jgi:hypothetical protein
MNTNTHNNLLSALPFLKKEKMDMLIKNLEQQYTQETRDFMRLTGNAQRWKPNHFTELYESEMMALYKGCLSIDAQHGTMVSQLQQERYQYWQLTALNTEKDILALYDQMALRTIQKKEDEAAMSYWDTHQIAVSKEIAHLKNEVLRNHALVDFGKSEDYKNLSLSQGVHVAIEYRKLQALEAQAKEDSFPIQPDQTLSESKLPNYPEVPPTYEFLNKQIEHEKNIEPPRLNNLLSTEQKVKSPIFSPPFADVSSCANFSEKISGPDYLVGELHLLKSSNAYGDAFARTYVQQECPEEHLELSAIAEAPFPSIKTNILAAVNQSKLLLTWFCVLGGIATEYLVYSAVLSGIFGFDGYKMWISGLVVLSLSKVLSFGLYDVVKKFISQANKLSWRYLKNSHLFYFLIFASLLYTLSLGVLYFDKLQEKKYTQEYVILQEQFQITKEEQSYDINQKGQAENPDLKKTETKVQKAADKIFVPNTPIIWLKGITVGFSSGLILLINAVLLNIAYLFTQSYLLKKRIAQLESQVNKKKAQFYGQKELIRNIRNKAFALFKIKGQIQFLHSLVMGSTPTDSFKEAQSKTEHFSYNGSLNGKSKEPLKL